ncbi:MAG: SDR family NAD(P)-dependent oxidoreductase [Pseudonocardiaceae bacterium]
MPGLLKALLVLKHRVIPVTLHATPLNPAIDFEGLKLAPATEAKALEINGRGVVGINSFGFGGANAHVVLAEGRRPTQPSTAEPVVDALPVVVSARSTQALVEAARLMSTRLAESKPGDFYDLCFTSARRRGHHPHRGVVLARTAGDAAKRLQALTEQPQAAGGGISQKTAHGRVAFVFCGNGSQWAGMGADLLISDPVFRAAVEAIDRRLVARLGWSVLAELTAPPNGVRTTRTEVAQPTLFAVQAGLVDMLRVRGIIPAAVMGHSVGEVAASYASGALDLDAACHVVAERGRCQASAAGLGRMAAVGLPQAEVQELLASWPELELAGINSDQDVTISGDAHALAALGEHLVRQEVFFRELDLDYPFHSQAMDHVEDPLRAGLVGLVPTETTIPMVSTMTGQPVCGMDVGIDYWWSNLRRPVQFAAAVKHLLAQDFDIFVEIGPHPVLRTYLRRLTTDADTPVAVVPTLVREADGEDAVQKSVASMIAAGAQVEWDTYFPRRGCVADLPAYPWQRERHWNGNMHRLVRSSGDGTVDHPLLGERMPGLDPIWQDVIEPVRVPWLADHRVGDSVVMPAAAYLEMALAAGRKTYETAVEVTDIQIPKALVVPWEEDFEVQLQFAMSAEDGFFHIASRHDDSSEWQIHATGRTRRMWRSEPDPVNLATLSAPLTEHVGHEDYYVNRVDGIEHGPAFQVLRELHVGDNEVLASYRLDAPQNGYEVHPTLLDGALQASGPLLSSFAAGHAFLPASIGTIRCWRQPSATGFVHVRSRTRNAQYACLDIEIIDDAGTVSIELRGVWLRRFEALGAEPVQHYVTVLRAAPHENTPAAPTPLPGVDELVTASAEHRAAVVPWLDRISGEGLRRMKELTAHRAVAALEHLVPVGHAFAWEDLTVAGILPKYQRLVELLLGMARAHGLAERVDGRRWRLIRVAEPNRMHQSLVADFPQHISELPLAGYVNSKLIEFLTGQADAVEVIFGENASLIEQYYEHGVAAAAYQLLARAFVQTVVQRWPCDRPLRILEVGGGTGGMTVSLLSVLPPERTKYIFTDLSAAFFGRAQTRFNKYDFVEYRVLDLDCDPMVQEFTEGSFDVVVAANVLHATKDLRRSVWRLSRLLSDGGLLLALEIHDPEFFVLPFGLFDGFWAFTDTDLRRRSPLLSRDQWPPLLRECGFSEVTQLGHEDEPIRNAGSLIVAGRDSRPEVPTALPPADLGARWIIAAEDGTEEEFASTVVTCLVEAGASQARAIMASRDTNEWTGALTDDGAPLRIALVLSAADPVDDSLPGWPRVATNRAVHRGAVLRAVSMACGALRATPDVTFWIVTRPSGVLPAPERAAVPDDAVAWGVARSLANEQPAMCPKRLSLERGANLAEDTHRLTRELLTPSAEDEIVLTRAGRFVPRVVPPPPAVDVITDADGTPYTLALRDQGLSYRLAWVPSSPKSPGPNEVVIEVRAAALNYRDVLHAVGMLPPEAIHGTNSAKGFGHECAGVVTAVGSEVTTMRRGDHVFGLASPALASHVVANAAAVRRIPDGMSFEEAATLPVVASTVQHSLGNLARLMPGEVLLVHGGAGGVGLAALQYAQHVGATVIATAGTDVKRNFLRAMGVEHVLDSRSLSFADEVLALTGEQGVDVVLNSLAGEAIPRSLELLRPYGRFIELGKRDILENKRLPLRPLERNISFFCVDLSNTELDNSGHGSPRIQLVTEQIKAGVYHPLPHILYPAGRIDEAFQLLQHSRHVGKIVVAFKTDVPVERPPVPLALDPQATYLITGGLSGVGAAVATWLAELGAGNLALVSRRGPEAPEAAELIDNLTRRGVTATAYAADVTDLASICEVIDSIDGSGYPLRGVLHAAMQLDDAPLIELDDDRFRTALATKMQGAVVLDAVTQARQLDFFVMISSMVALVGNLGQANYASGNLFLQALARNRRTHGRPGQAIEWGAIGEVGVVARTGIENVRNRFGSTRMRPTEALAGLRQLLCTDTDVLAVCRVDWGRARKLMPIVDSPRLAGNLPPVIEGAGQDREEFLRLVTVATPEKSQALLQQALIGLLARVLQTTADRINPTDRLDQLGMDSLMRSELLVAIRQQLGCDIPVMEAARVGTITDLAHLTLARLKPADAAPQAG